MSPPEAAEAAEAEEEVRIPNWPVHPLAAKFPRLDADALAELAADIKANGLQQPITLGSWFDEATGRMIDEGLVDGRNRLAACRLIGIMPAITRLPADRDPVDFILSVNVARRHLTAGQQAMAWAIGHPDPAKGGRGKTLQPLKSFSQGSLSQARAVLKELAGAAQAVLDGTLPLEVAYHQVQANRRHAAARHEAMVELGRAEPDLAALVQQQTISFEGAMDTAAARQRVRRMCQEFCRELDEALAAAPIGGACAAELDAVCAKLRPLLPA